MTERGIKNKKSPSLRDGLSAGQVLFCVMSVLALLLTFRHSQTAISAMSDGMRLCTATVIPALFPFMVLSELLVSSGAAELVSKAVGGIFEKLFGIRREGCIAFLLGIVCGFPIGTKSAVSLYERGKISKQELERLLSFCNGPSSAFLISAVGVSLFGSREFGIMLYAVEIISAIIIGIGGRFCFSHKRQKETFCESAPKATSNGSGLLSVVQAVTSSAVGMLYICAFVVFFSAVTGILNVYADAAKLPYELKTVIVGFFEMTGGVASAASLPRYSACLCTAAMIGWSGLSVHFQLVSLCSDHKIAFRPYFAAKLARALLNLLFVAVGLRLFEEHLHFGQSIASSFLMAPKLHPIHIFTLAIFGVVSLCLSFRRVK